MRIRTLLMLALVATPAYGQTWRVVDGDTVVIDGETVRIANIDTPEIKHAQCDAERRLGLVAKRELDTILASGSLTLERGDPASGRQKDKYGRTLGVISVDGHDVGDTLTSRQMSRP